MGSACGHMDCSSCASQTAAYASQPREILEDIAEGVDNLRITDNRPFRTTRRRNKPVSKGAGRVPRAKVGPSQREENDALQPPKQPESMPALSKLVSSIPQCSVDSDNGKNNARMIIYSNNNIYCSGVRTTEADLTVSKSKNPLYLPGIPLPPLPPDLLS